MTYEHLEVWRGDPRLSSWLDELPAILDACSRRWSLTLGEPWTNSIASLTMPASRDGEAVVLKIGIPDREGELEGEALRRLDGSGAVLLLDEDPDRRVMLLERCTPGTPLTNEDTEAALDVLIGLLPRVWIAAGEPFRPLADEVADLIVEMREHWEGTGRTIEERLIDAATEAFESLAPTQGEQVLVNQDLHADNVLAAEREPWLLIDPKPLMGEREFGVASIVRGRELGHTREAVLRRLDRVTAELGLDRERARLWSMAHTVSWCFDDDGPMREHIEAATWLLDAA
ncbi:MAG TPA: aminoglycoside phosphotransferase family protein [Actinomycetota bacterium]|nr:aminoglycoside phosphotransferase family protein [Actinomycetota bacterium]